VVLRAGAAVFDAPMAACTSKKRRGVRFAIERLRAEAPEAGVIIKADADARNELVIRVMDAAKAAGVREVIIAAGEI